MRKAARPGMPLLDLYTADWYNSINRSIAKQTQFRPPSNTFADTPSKIQVIGDFDKNTFEAVNLEDPMLIEDSATPDNSDMFTSIKCEVTEPLTPEKWAILQTPLAQDQEGIIVLHGLTWAYFNLLDVNHTCVDVVSGNLVSGDSGRGKIIHHKGTTGLGYGLIDIGYPQDRFIFGFTLTANMSGGSANATIKQMDGTVKESSQVVDTLSLFSHLESGESGICFLAEDNLYYVIAPDEDTNTGTDTSAHLFELTSDLTGSSATAEVLVSGETGVLVGETITVQNKDDFRTGTGAHGVAIKVGAEYWIVEINQYPILMTGTLSNATHDISPSYQNNLAAARQQATTYSSLVTSSSYPFSFLPVSPTVENPHNFAAISGDKVLITYNRTDNEFQIIKVLPQKARLIKFKMTADPPGGFTWTSTDTTALESISCEGDLPADGFSLRSEHNFPIKLSDTDEGIAQYNLVNDNYEIVQTEKICTRFRGTIQTAFSATPTDISVTPVYGFNGNPPGGTTTVKNIYSWEEGSLGSIIAAEWNPELDQWEAYQMELPQPTPAIIDLRLSGSNLQYTLDGVTWTTWTTGTACP